MLLEGVSPHTGITKGDSPPPPLPVREGRRFTFPIFFLSISISYVTYHHPLTAFLPTQSPPLRLPLLSLHPLKPHSPPSTLPDREAMITDACVPLSRLPDLIAHTRADLDRSFLPAPIIAHAGDGNFHALIMLDPSLPAETAEAHRLAGNITRRAIAMGGTCTGEHGVGVGKKGYLREEMGPGAMDLMERIKRAVDPGNVMNPGKILDVGQELEKKQG